MKKALVLFSGGQDSTTCLLWAISKVGKENVYAISFDYGQRHAIELVQARKISDLLEIASHEIFDCKNLLSGSSLTDHSKNLNSQHDRNSNLPSTFTAGRNALFLTIAASYGYSKDIFDIVTGVCQTDFSGYPDCRRRFIDSMVTSLSLALEEDIRIYTPLMYLNKAETWRLAKELDKKLSQASLTEMSTYEFSVFELVRTMTMTDYSGDMTMNEWGMGNTNNSASQIRAKGFYDARMNDWI